MRVREREIFPFLLSSFTFRAGETISTPRLITSRTESHTEGIELARHFGAQCIETSAKQRIMVDEVFMELVRAIRRYNKVSWISTEYEGVDLTFSRHVCSSRFILDLVSR